MQDVDDHLEFVEVGSLAMNFVYFCEYCFMIIQDSSSVKQELLEKVSLQLVRGIRCLCGPDLQNSLKDSKIKIDNLVSSTFSGQTEPGFGYLSCSCKGKEEIEWWKVKLKSAELNISRSTFKVADVENLELFVFDESIQFIADRSNDEQHNINSNLLNIQTYLKAKYLSDPLLDGGLTSTWEESVDLIYLEENTPSIIFCSQASNLNFVLVFKIKVNKDIISLIQLISGLLYSKSDNWKDLEQYLKKKLIITTLSIQELASNTKELERIYKELVSNLTRECNKVLKRFRSSEVEISYLRPIQRHLSSKFTVLPDSLSSKPSIENKLWSLSEDILDFQIMCDSSSKFVRFQRNYENIQDCVPVFSFLTESSTGCNQCSTNLTELDNFRIFRMRLSLDFLLNLTKTGLENNKEEKGHISVIAVFRISDKPFDIGHFTLLFVKFINNFVIHSIL